VINVAPQNCGAFFCLKTTLVFFERNHFFNIGTVDLLRFRRWHYYNLTGKPM